MIQPKRMWVGTDRRKKPKGSVSSKGQVRKEQSKSLSPETDAGSYWTTNHRWSIAHLAALRQRVIIPLLHMLWATRSVYILRISYRIGHVYLLLWFMSRTQLPLLSHVVGHTFETDESYLLGHVYLFYEFYHVLNYLSFRWLRATSSDIYAVF